MQENPESESRSEEAPKKPRGGLMKEILIYVVAMFVMTIAAVVMITLIFKGDLEGDAAAPERSGSVADADHTDASPQKDDPVYTFEPSIVVNTADPEASRFLSVKVHVVFGKFNVKAEMENSEVLQYQMRDLFITVFSSKTAAELQDSKEKETLKNYLKEEINQLLEKDSVKQVYFSEYIIQ